MDPLQVDRDLDESVEKPADPSPANRIIRSSEAQILGDMIAPRDAGFCRCIIDHLGPDLIEFGHKREDRTRQGKTQFRGIIWYRKIGVWVVFL